MVDVKESEKKSYFFLIALICVFIFVISNAFVAFRPFDSFNKIDLPSPPAPPDTVPQSHPQPPPNGNSGAQDCSPSSSNKNNSFFNRPDILYVNEPVSIQLVVDINGLSETEKSELFVGMPGCVAGKNVSFRKWKYLRAKLSASGYMTIESQDDRVRETKNVSRIDWVWNVQPLRPGAPTVTLELFGQDSKNEDAAVRSAPILRETWKVEARGIEWFKYNITEFTPVGQAIVGVGGVITSILAFFGIGALKKRAENSDRMPKSDVEDKDT